MHDNNSTVCRAKGRPVLPSAGVARGLDRRNLIAVSWDARPRPSRIAQRSGGRACSAISLRGRERFVAPPGASEACCRRACWISSRIVPLDAPGLNLRSIVGGLYPVPAQCQAALASLRECSVSKVDRGFEPNIPKNISILQFFLLSYNSDLASAAA